MKKRKAINKPASFMNQTVRREIYTKKNITNTKNVKVKQIGKIRENKGT